MYWQSKPIQCGALIYSRLCHDTKNYWPSKMIAIKLSDSNGFEGWMLANANADQKSLCLCVNVYIILCVCMLSVGVRGMNCHRTWIGRHYYTWFTPGPWALGTSIPFSFLFFFCFVMLSFCSICAYVFFFCAPFCGILCWNEKKKNGAKLTAVWWDATIYIEWSNWKWWWETDDSDCVRERKTYRLW